MDVENQIEQQKFLTRYADIERLPVYRAASNIPRVQTALKMTNRFATQLNVYRAVSATRNTSLGRRPPQHLDATLGLTQDVSKREFQNVALTRLGNFASALAGMKTDQIGLINYELDDQLLGFGVVEQLQRAMDEEQEFDFS